MHFCIEDTLDFLFCTWWTVWSSRKWPHFWLILTSIWFRFWLTLTQFASVFIKFWLSMTQFWQSFVIFYSILNQWDSVMTQYSKSCLSFDSILSLLPLSFDSILTQFRHSFHPVFVIFLLNFGSIILRLSQRDLVMTQYTQYWLRNYSVSVHSIFDSV